MNKFTANVLAASLRTRANELSHFSSRELRDMLATAISVERDAILFTLAERGR